MAATSVVVVERWPLVRMGIGRALPSLNYRILEEVDSASRAAAVIRRRRPQLVVVGSHLEAEPVAVVLVAKEVGARVVALVPDGVGRRELAALAEAGAVGILACSVDGAGLEAAARRVLAGERALSPELVPALAGVLPPPPAANGTGPARRIGDLLTGRERQVLACLVRGARNEEIASELFLSPATVKTHLSHIYTKLGVRGRHEATARALQLRLVR
jgi:DNA-binding NarL/FixJ family response regulator